MPDSLDEAGRMLDAFEGFAQREAGDKYREEITAALIKARARLGKLRAGE